MTDRILDITEAAAHLCFRDGLLVVDVKDGQPVTLPVAEIGSLVLSAPRVTITQPALANLAGALVSVIICDAKCNPVGMLLPLDSHFTQAERFSAQARTSRPVGKRLWRQLIRAKIRAQGRLLKELYGKDEGLSSMAARVRSGDPENLEAQASRRYWRILFADKNFRRDRQGEDENRNLNYGYAILRAMVSRAICAAGLHPSLGLHHHNRYNAFCLADDLMEPFRPIVDKAVVQWKQSQTSPTDLDMKTKRYLLERLMSRFDLDGESRVLFDILARVASSLAAVFLGERDELLLPDVGP